MAERLATPLQVAADGRFVTVEQDSDADVVQCIRAICRTRTGERPDLPDMGVQDPTHGEQPIDADAAALSDVVEKYEPRVSALAITNPALVNGLLNEAVEDLGWTRSTAQEA